MINRPKIALAGIVILRFRVHATINVKCKGVLVRKEPFELLSISYLSKIPETYNEIRI
jgi:hypothetical protein